MWLFLPHAFLSIVDKGDPSHQTLLVRARNPDDIQRVFPNADIQTGGGTDYAYRARINREEVAQVMAEAIRSIDYPNFKNEVDEPLRHDAYMECWSAMYHYQSEQSSSRKRTRS
jgi:hypothetical protein